MKVHLLRIVKLDSKMYSMVFYFCGFHLLSLIAPNLNYRQIVVFHSMATFKDNNQSNIMISEPVSEQKMPDTAFDG